MELLIVFIVMMVISSILKSFRGTGGRTFTQPAPRRLERPVFPDIFDFPEGNIEEKPSDGLDILEWPGYGQEAETLVREVFKEKKDEPVFTREKPRRQVPRPQKTVTARAARVPRKEERNIGKNLQELLSGERLPLGIVAAEVFSAPRARRPFGRKMR